LNGVHDLGGMHGFGPVVREENEPVFHADWERRVFALFLMAGPKLGTLDAMRHAIERIPPASYLRSTYYERWLYALETRLIEKSFVSREELDAAQTKIRNLGWPIEPVHAEPDKSTATAVESINAKPLGGVTLESPRHANARARFHVGSRVVARNINPEGHTRLPRYARGRRGIVRYDWGVFPFPDTNALDRGPKPQHCYGVEFKARERWGLDHPANQCVFIDLWEDYLAEDRTASGGMGSKAAAKAREKKSRASGTRGQRPSRAQG
jgi:nitrile hydratase subunit beta